MGSLISSNRKTSVSLRFYEMDRQRRRRRSELEVTEREKRSSATRPVLRLQVKPETLEREVNSRRRAGSNVHLVTKGTLRTLTRDSGAYDHLVPRHNSLSSRDHVHHLRRHSVESRDSMVVVQFVDNGQYGPGLLEGRKDENDYDKLLPPGEFEHLCTCTYGRVSPSTTRERSEGVMGDGGRREDGEEHLTTITIGNQQPAMIQTTMTVDQLRERILQHIPPEADYNSSGVQRSKSTTAISSYQLHEGASPFYQNQRRLRVHSTSFLDNDDAVGDYEWTLGESIMRTLSRSDVHLFDIDNPMHESEKEVNRVWPELRHKIKKWRHSQHNLDRLDETESGFSESTSPTHTSHTHTSHTHTTHTLTLV